LSISLASLLLPPLPSLPESSLLPLPLPLLLPLLLADSSSLSMYSLSPSLLLLPPLPPSC
jgi:hypothetical protein